MSHRTVSIESSNLPFFGVRTYEVDVLISVDLVGFVVCQFVTVQLDDLSERLEESKLDRVDFQ